MTRPTNAQRLTELENQLDKLMTMLNDMLADSDTYEASQFESIACSVESIAGAIRALRDSAPSAVPSPVRDHRRAMNLGE